jgi:hypothetical protein
MTGAPQSRQALPASAVGRAKLVPPSPHAGQWNTHSTKAPEATSDFATAAGPRAGSGAAASMRTGWCQPCREPARLRDWPFGPPYLGRMTTSRPSARSLLALHLACGLPIVALAAWLSLIDRLPLGEGRCSSCGVEGHVIAAHVVAAGWLGAVVAYTAAARRQVREGIGAPGRVTTGALACVGVFALASLIWHTLFSVPAFVAMIASVVLLPAAGIWWLIGAVAWLRRPPQTAGELGRRLGGELVAAWVSLTLLLPAVFGWVWADRVDWLVF